MEPEHGAVLLVDKPAGPTSHDVVQEARRALGTRRVGHAGTLDPFATGLLLLCAGRATRLVEYFHLLSKTYEASLRLGIETDTHDPEGRVVGRSEAWHELGPTAVEDVLSRFRGRLVQRPPAFSAKRVGGRRAHRAARHGEAVELEPVPVEVHRLEVVACEPPSLRLRAEVSTGTYLRALARDLGRALGCGAHLRALRREAIGPFGVGDAVAPSDLAGLGQGRAAWRTPAEALAWLPSRHLAPEEAERARSGARVPADSTADPGGAAGALPVTLVHEGRLVAVAELLDGELQPRKVLDAR